MKIREVHLKWPFYLPFLSRMAAFVFYPFIVYNPKSLKVQRERDFKVLRQHEWVHIDQVRRDGILLMPLKYLYYLIRYGYKDNPYEVEARKLERVERASFE